MSDTGNGCMINFLKDSDNFAGITFAGCFNIDMDHFQVIYDHYQKTGKNYLDDYCQVKYAIWDGKPPQVDPFSDHVRPVSKGGKNEIANLQPLCKICNSTKRTKLIDYRKL